LFAARYDGSASVKTWVYTIARNKLIDANRKNRHLPVSDAMPEQADTTPNPEALAIAAGFCTMKILISAANSTVSLF
jgi:RNA polymerase sigma-70 factor (ECF subfamily)